MCERAARVERGLSDITGVILVLALEIQNSAQITAVSAVLTKPSDLMNFSHHNIKSSLPRAILADCLFVTQIRH